MKKKIFVFIFIIVIIISISSKVVLHVNTINEYQAGYLVWADKTINVYNYTSNMKTEYSFEEYDCRCIGKYYNGDFCCVGDYKGDEFILLFEGGNMVDSIYIPYSVEQVASLKGKIIFRSKNQIFSVERQSGACVALVDNVNGNFYLNANGDIAFIRTDKEFSTLYVYSNGKEIKLGNATRIMCWSPNGELIVEKFNRNITQTNYGSKTIVETKKYIVNINTNSWKETSLFENVFRVAAWTVDNKTICWFYATNSTEYQPLGLVDFDTGIKSKWALDNDVIKYNDGPIYFEWFEENPLETRGAQGTVSVKT